jgi:hypothetical protein
MLSGILLKKILNILVEVQIMQHLPLDTLAMAITNIGMSKKGSFFFILNEQL